MTGKELIQELNDLSTNTRHIGNWFDKNFKADVIGMRHRIPTDIYNTFSGMVNSKETIDLAEAYINNKLREMKAQPGTPQKTHKK